MGLKSIGLVAIGAIAGVGVASAIMLNDDEETKQTVDVVPVQVAAQERAEAPIKSETSEAPTIWYDDAWPDEMGQSEDFGVTTRHSRARHGHGDAQPSFQEQDAEHRRAEREKRRAERENRRAERRNRRHEYEHDVDDEPWRRHHDEPDAHERWGGEHRPHGNWESPVEWRRGRAEWGNEQEEWSKHGWHRDDDHENCDDNCDDNCDEMQSERDEMQWRRRHDERRGDRRRHDGDLRGRHRTQNHEPPAAAGDIANVNVTAPTKLNTAFRNESELTAFASTVLASLNSVWNEQLKQNGKRFRPPKLHVFTDEIASDCGEVDFDTGPFYCSSDEGLYLDLTFFQTLKEELETDSAFAFAYVIAHEYGHHVQNLLGDLEKYAEREETLRERGKETKANLISVQTELQADFLAGVWAYHDESVTENITEDDIEQVLWSAATVGDDILGEESPESFSHGSAEMRIEWLARGMMCGDLSYGNTFQYSLNELASPPELPEDTESDAENAQSDTSNATAH